ncbi:MAG TPA: cysteine desulfurase-like protein [Gemmatales bacterium]|nr:cysteine desulfurase-like protein [Gemmatales bacterium]HMP59746.1 cysteine desulfurase-like protein [Gemmatales bacterium]
MVSPLDVAACRACFPALERLQAGRPVVYADGPAGSQVPVSVAEAVTGYLLRHNANHDGMFATSRESDALIAAAHRASAELLGATDPDEVVFGANMTTLCLALSRALARTWNRGDEVVVTRIDHDANVTPWVRAAEDAGAVVRFVDIHPGDCTLNLDDLKRKLGPRTQLVAVACASNAVGTLNPLPEIVAAAHGVGALVCLDAVHFAPHALMDVADWDADFVLCSAYKFFGPHVGLLWGRRTLLEDLKPYKVRPASNDLPGRWMTGTQNHEGLAGLLAAIDYLASLSGADSAQPRRERLAASFAAIVEHERQLATRFLEGVAPLAQWKVWGITDKPRRAERVPTFALTHEHLRPRDAAAQLADQGIFTWHGNFYAIELTETLGLEPHGLLRIGFLHYNTLAEVDRVVAALAELR